MNARNSRSGIDQHATASTAGAATASGEECRPAVLLRTIEGEIIPRLLMVARLPQLANVPGDEDGGAADSADVAELARVLLAHGPEVGLDFVDAVRQRGAPLDRICVEGLAPTARRLVALWEQEDCDDAQVRLGLNALHLMLLELRGSGSSDRYARRRD